MEECLESAILEFQHFKTAVSNLLTIFNFLMQYTLDSSNDSIYRKYQYIVFDIDILFRIVEKILNFLIYHNILCQKFIILLLHYQNNENK